MTGGTARAVEHGGGGVVNTVVVVVLTDTEIETETAAGVVKTAAVVVAAKALLGILTELNTRPAPAPAGGGRRAAACEGSNFPSTPAAIDAIDGGIAPNKGLKGLGGGAMDATGATAEAIV